MMEPTISVIIPAWQEASTIARCLVNLQTQMPHEVIVVDADSPDGTAEIARDRGVRVVRSPRGRATQQNHGAAAATGTVLCFLHADCVLEAGALATVSKYLRRNPRVPGGCLRMRVDDPHLAFRSIDAAAHLRAGVLRIPYGDQAIFVRRSVFEAVGGFPRVQFMEDVMMGLRLRRVGRMALLSPIVKVSPRRWLQVGLAQQTMLNWSLTGLAALGVPPDTLARWYRVIR